MPTVPKAKARIIRVLGALSDSKTERSLHLTDPENHNTIRAVAELVVEGIVCFDEEALTCQLTNYGAFIATMMRREKG